MKLNYSTGLLNGGANNANAASQNFNTGINIPGIFGARFGASNAAANANSAGLGGASNSNAAAQSVGAGINVLGVDLGWGASNAASNSGGFFGR